MKPIYGYLAAPLTIALHNNPRKAFWVSFRNSIVSAVRLEGLDNGKPL